MLEIVNVRHGAVLNCNHGVEGNCGLEFEVAGLAEITADVWVNGVIARRKDRQFFAKILLDKKYNKITVRAHDHFGDEIREIQVVYDKNSFRRYNFFIDDNSFFLTDLAKQRPKSLFDHFYLRALKNIHDEFGTKFTLNCFYRNDHDPDHFEISAMPELWKGEFEDNSSWLRLSFHAYSEFPSRPYQNATGKKLAEDYDLIKREICRFAGEENFIPPVALHWSITNPDNFKVLKQRNVQVMSGQFISARTRPGEEASAIVTTDIGYFYEQDVARYIAEQKAWYDFDTEMMLIHPSCCCNLDNTAQLDKKITDSMAIGNNIMSLETHEQYCFPSYFNYMPDHIDRMRYAAKLAFEGGYEPVFFAQGLLGNLSWEG